MNEQEMMEAIYRAFAAFKLSRREAIDWLEIIGESQNDATRMVDEWIDELDPEQL